jgi:hypothetical protein
MEIAMSPEHQDKNNVCATDPQGDKWPDSGLYRALVSLYVHQDRLLWGRIQLLIAIQGAVIASGYVTRHSWIGPAVMFAGAFLTLVTLRLAYKDSLDRDVNLELMDELGRNLVPSAVVQKLSRPDATALPIRMSADTPKWLRWLRGTRIIWGMIGVFVFIDVALGVMYAVCPRLFDLN